MRSAGVDRARYVPQRSAATSWRWYAFAFFSLLVLGMLCPAGARALSLEQVGNFATPTYVTSDPGDPDRLFVVERKGRIQLVENGQSSLFLDITSIVLGPRDDGAFRGLGLYSMAFSPEFATDSLFYVAYSSADDPNTENEDESFEWHLAEFTAAGDSADPASRREVLTIKYPEARLHYAGQLHFGPDGYLFASTGDGGPQGDPDGNAQNLNNLNGNILRIDPHSTPGSAYTVPADNPFAGEIPGKDEIWSYGLRNPWRFSFDRLTGDLVIGDVGHGAREEVDFATGADPGKGANFGWNCWQGTIQFSTAPPCDAEQTFTDPVFEYEHVDGNCSITGGYVVRDPALGDLFGRYLYADFCVGELRSLDLESPVLDRSEGLCVQFPTSFGEDSSGRIYVTSFDGPVYRLAAGGSSGACAPDTQIDSGPAGPTNDPNPSFAFSSSEPNSTFECRLDSGAWSACSSPKGFSNLTDGPHTFEVRATDAAGYTDPTPATMTFTVDTTAPDTTIDSGPTGTITTDQASFTFSGDPASDTARIQCRIDSEPFADCSSPKTFTGLADGPHTAEFRVEDAAGNQDATPATRTFTVDTSVDPPVVDPPVDPPVGEAKIGKVKVKGPAKVKRKKKATYKVKIKNSGNAKATGVRLKVKGRGVNSKTSVGKIGAMKTRTVKIKLKPKKPGKVKLTFKVTSKNAGGRTVKKKIRVKK